MNRERAINLLKEGYKKFCQKFPKDDLNSAYINEIASFIDKIEKAPYLEDDFVLTCMLFEDLLVVRLDRNAQMDKVRSLSDDLSVKNQATENLLMIQSIKTALRLLCYEPAKEELLDNIELMKTIKSTKVTIGAKDETDDNPSSQTKPVMWYKDFVGPRVVSIDAISKLEKLIGPQREFDFFMEREDRDVPQITVEKYLECIERRLKEADKSLQEHDLPLDSFSEISEYIRKVKNMDFNLGEISLMNEYYFGLVQHRLYKDIKWIKSGKGSSTIAEDDINSKKKATLSGLLMDLNSGIYIEFYDTRRASIKEELKYPCPESENRWNYLYPEVVSKLESVIGPQPEFDKSMGRR